MGSTISELIFFRGGLTGLSGVGRKRGAGEEVYVGCPEEAGRNKKKIKKIRDSMKMMGSSEIYSKLKIKKKLKTAISCETSGGLLSLP